MVANTPNRRPRRRRIDPRTPPATPPETMATTPVVEDIPTVTQDEDEPPSPEDVTPPRQHDNNVSDNGSSVVQRLIWCMHQKNLPENTKKAYQNKGREWMAYCNHCYGDIPVASRYFVDSDKTHKFLAYQAFRQQRTRGGRKTEVSSVLFSGFTNYMISNSTLFYVQQDSSGGFCCTDFDNVMSRLGDMTNMSDPDNPVGIQAITQYKAVVKMIWMGQVANKESTLPWDLIWTQHHKVLVDLVKNRKQRIAKSRYDEKVCFASSPYHIVSEIPNIEKECWNRGKGISSRSQLAWLRNRFCFLYSLHGILRYESLQNAELSDCFSVGFKKERDPHMLNISVIQLATGKTNHGIKLYGRCLRHKDVKLCGVGAMAMYLMYRFELSKEMDPPPDFTKNDSWFDIKLLTDGTIQNITTGIANTTYGDHMKLVIRHLGIPAVHWRHKQCAFFSICTTEFPLFVYNW